MTEADYYCVNDLEIVTTTTVEEAVQQWYEDYGYDENPVPEQVEVRGYKTKTFHPNGKIFEWVLENLYENLDENYGCEETFGDYKLSPEAQELFDKFIEQVKKEYPISQLEPVGKPFMVNLRDYVEVDND